MHGSDAKRWATAFHTVVSQNPELLNDEAFLIGWFAKAIARGHEDARFKMEQHDSVRRRNMAAFGYYLSYHCDRNPLPDAEGVSTEMAETMHSDRGMLTLAREFLFGIARNDIVFPDEESGIDQGLF